MRTQQYILLVPTHRGDPETDLVQILQQLRIKTKAGRAFDGENGGHLPLCAELFHFRCAVSQLHKVRILIQLTLNGGNFPLENQGGCGLIPLFHHGCGKAGEALAVTIQHSGPIQVNVELILAQIAGFVRGFAQQSQGGITMQVKYRNIHWKASSKW